MTIANETNRISAVGSGAIGQEVPFSFPITATSDLAVYKRVTATGVQTNLDETTNYTVVISDDTGGTLTTVTAIETTEQIHIVRNAPYTQSLDLVAGGSFSAEDVEDMGDKNTKLSIQNRDLLDNKAILFPATDASSLTTILPSAIDRASKNLTFDASGNVTASASVEEGSVTFTDFGTNMAEAANALAGKAVINLDHLFDVRDYGATGDGSTNDATAVSDTIDAAAASGGVVFFPQGTYVFDDDDTVPYNVTLQFVPGALLQIETGKVVTIQGTILAGNHQIFSGSGFTNTVQFPGYNNVCWYPGSSINDKWDAMINEWPDNQDYHKIIYIPNAIEGNPASINYGAGDKYVAWKLDGALDIDGACNNSKIICNGLLYVETGSALTNAVVISSTDKIENVYFPRGLKIECNDAANNGLMIKGGARIDFGDMIHVAKCVNGLVINGDTFLVSEIHINKVYVGTWSGSAVILNGNNNAVISVTIDDIQAQVTQSATCKVLEITGRVPDFVIGHVAGTKVLGTGTHDIQYGILIQADTNGAPAYFRANIKSGYFDYVTTAIKTEDTSLGVALKIRGLDIGPIHAGSCTTFADLGYLQECRLDIIDFDDPITVGADCQDVRLITQKDVSGNITDNGVRTRINGLGTIAGTASTKPTTGNWEIGEIVRVTADDKLYLKVQDTDVDVIDFILVRTGEVVCNDNQVVCNENQVVSN